MKIEISLRQWMGYDDDPVIATYICNCDNVRRALDMYEDQCEHNQYLTYKIIDDIENDDFENIECPHCNSSFEKIDFGDVECPNCSGIVGY